MRQIDDLPERELQRWRLYWCEEPWGSYRDNLHAAMLCVEVLRPHMREGSKLKVQDFMIEHVEDREERARAKFLLEMEAEVIRSERAEKRKRKTP